MDIDKTEIVIQNMIDRCSEAEQTGITEYPSMSYEDGVKAALEWVVGYTETAPFDD